MITFTYLSLGFIILVFIVLFCLNKKDKSIKLKAWNSIIDSVTFTSGIILIFYLIGRAWNLDYLKQADEFSLGLALVIASIILIFDTIDKYYRIIKKKKIPAGRE
jgi:uncharacterized membrane protein SirB2